MDSAPAKACEELFPVDAETPGADQQEGKEDGAEFDRMGGDEPFFHDAAGRGVEVHHRGHHHVDGEEEAGGAEAESDQQKESPGRLRKCGHQPPEERVSTHSHELHRLAELDPDLGTTA